MDPLLEVKTMLRSILISSPVVIDVYQLNKDFKEQAGFGIPYKKFGHKSLIDFLKSIPDVLLINGNSEYSEVTPVASEKSSHVNDLVLRQKSSSKPGRFFSKNCKPSKNRHNTRTIHNKQTLVHLPAPQNRKQSEVISKVKADDGYSSQKSNSDKSINAKTPSTNQMTSFLGCNKKSNRVENRPTNYNSPRGSLREIRKRLNSTNKDIEGFSKNNSNKNIMNYETFVESTKLLRRINYKDNSSNVDTSLNEDNSFYVDISLRGSEKQADKIYWQGGFIKKTNKRNNTIENCRGRENPPEKNIKSNRSGYFTTNSICHLMESAVKNKSEQNHNKKKIETHSFRTMKNHIPQDVQDNLKSLISGYPEGIWCAELPLFYKDSTGKDLCFEEYGYRCLIYLCLDLEHIFHCIKESTSDYKLYDVRKPLPEFNIPQEHSYEEITQNSELLPAIPEMTWGSFDIFLPEDAVRLGFKPNRIKAAEALETKVEINVIVAEIYDVSKFWIIIDDSKLDKLMDDMQLYYGINGKRYLIPKSLLVETLYCVVLFKDKFHRAIILNKMPGYEYLKVYYVDFGTLGKVSKSEVWFITKEFSELPTQAIRARIGDIYPPYKGVTWSPFANYDFSSLTCMRKLIAKIMSVDQVKNLVHIKLYDEKTNISDILVERNLAKFIETPQQKHIDDPNCKSGVTYAHLFPNFDEIENWIVPSMEEAADFLSTSITADFLYSQYFKRIVDNDLIESIEEKMKIICRKKKALMKNQKSSEILLSHNIVEMNKIAYGSLYDFFITEHESENSIEEKQVEEKQETKKQEENQEKENHINKIETNEEDECEFKGAVEAQNVSFTKKRVIDIENDGLMVGILRQVRMKKSYSLQDDNSQENLDTLETILNGRDPKNITMHSNIFFEDLSKTSNDIEISCKNYSYISNEISNFLELETDENSFKTSKKSTINLIDLDNELSPIVSSTNLLLDLEFEHSLVKLAESRQKIRKCLLTGSSMENPLDSPIPCNVPCSTFPDLMQFDDDVSVPKVTSTIDEQVCAMPMKPIFKVADCTESSDADDENSDVQQNSYTNKSKETEKMNLNHKLNDIKTVPTLQEESGMFVNNNIKATPNESENGNCIGPLSDEQNIKVEQPLILNSLSRNLEILESQSSHKDYCEIVDSSNVNESNYKQKLPAQNKMYHDFNNSLEQEKKIQRLMTENLNCINKNRYSEHQLDISNVVNASSIFEDQSHCSQNDFTLGGVHKHNMATSNVTNSAAIGDAVSENFLIPNFHLPEISDGDTISNDFRLLKLEGEAINSSRLKINNSATAIYSQNLFDSSIVTIDSAECESEFIEPSISRLSFNLKTPENKERITDLNEDQAFSSITSSAVASTPLPNQSALIEDRSFLEEFDILDHSISPSISDLRSETVLSRLSFLSGEWISIELQNSKCETNNPGPLNEPQSMHPEVSVENKLVSPKNSFVSDDSMSLESSCFQLKMNNNIAVSVQESAVKENVSKKLDNAERSVNPTSSNWESASIPGSQVGNLKHDFNQHVFSTNAVPSTPSYPRVSAPVYGIQTWMHPPGVLVRGPPIPFIPIPPSAHQTVSFPPGPQFHVPINHYNCVPRSQQAIINGAGQNYGTCPMFIINFNFLPPMNQNSK